MTKLKRYAIMVALAIAAFFGKQTYDRNVGARENERKRTDEDRESAVKVADGARDARVRDRGDQRDPVDRVRELGGLRDDTTDRK